MSQNDGKEPPIYVETLHNHRHHDYTATVGDAIHRFPVRLAEIWNQFDQIPNVPDPSLLLDGDSSGVTQLAKNRALVLVTGTTHKFELAAVPTDLSLVVTATQGLVAPIAGNLAPTLAAVPQPATGFTPVIQDSTGAVFEMQAAVWVVDGLNHIVEFPYGVPTEMVPPFALTFVRYTGSTGGSSSAPVMASWEYVADATGTSFVADTTFPGATVADWLTGEAAAAIAQSTEGAGTRAMLDVSKGAFRAGVVTGAQWNDANRGVGSAAFGTDNTAATANSLVAGGSGLTLTDQDSTLYTQRLRLAGGLQVPVNVVAVDTLATIDDLAFSVDTTGGVVTITLPAAPVAGQLYRVKHLLGGNATIVAGNGNNVDQGDGTTGASSTLPDAGDSATFLWDDASSVWLVVDTGGAASAGAAFTYVADVTGTSLVADTAFPGAVVADWLVGEAAAAIAQSTEGAGSRTMFDVSKGAFRAGTVTGAQWDDANRGVGSAAFGTDNTAATANSLVAGGSGLTLTDQDSTFYTQRLRQAGGLQIPVNVVAVDTLATIDDYAFSVDTTGGAVAVTLPAAPVAGQLYRVKYLLGANAVTVAGNGNPVDQGDGTTGANFSLANPGDAVTVLWDDATGVWLAMDDASGGSTPVVPVPAVLDLYVSTTGDDFTGDGTIGLPYLTIQRALEDAQTLGWDDEATITILASGGNFILPSGDISFNAGTRGEQRTPLRIRGSGRTVVGNDTVGAVAAYGSSDLSVEYAGGYAYAAADIGRTLVRFTSGPASSFALNSGFPATTAVDAFMGNLDTGSSLFLLPFAGGGTSPVPVTGNTFVLETLDTTVELTGTLKIRSDANTIVFEEFNLVAHGSGGASAIIAMNTAIATYAVRMVVDAGTSLSLSNPDAAWYAGNTTDDLATGLVATTRSISIDTSAAGSSVLGNPPDVQRESADKRWSGVVGVGGGGSTDLFEISGDLREFFWHEGQPIACPAGRPLNLGGSVLSSAGIGLQISGSATVVSDLVVDGAAATGISVVAGGRLVADGNTVDALNSGSQNVNVVGGFMHATLLNLGAAVQSNVRVAAGGELVADVPNPLGASNVGFLATGSSRITLVSDAVIHSATSTGMRIVSGSACNCLGTLDVDGSATGLVVEGASSLTSGNAVRIFNVTARIATVREDSRVSAVSISSSAAGGDGWLIESSTVATESSMFGEFATGTGIDITAGSVVTVQDQVRVNNASFRGLAVRGGSKIYVGSIILSRNSSVFVESSEAIFSNIVDASSSPGNGLEIVSGSSVVVSGELRLDGNVSGAALVVTSSTLRLTTAETHDLSGGAIGLVATDANIYAVGGFDCRGSTGDGMQLLDSSVLTIVPALGETPVDVSGSGGVGLTIDRGSRLEVGVPNIADGAIVASGCATNIQVSGGSTLLIGEGAAAAITATGATGSRGMTVSGGSRALLGDCPVDVSGANSICFELLASEARIGGSLDCQNSSFGFNLLVNDGSLLVVTGAVAAQTAPLLPAVSVLNSRVQLGSTLNCRGAPNATGLLIGGESFVTVAGAIVASTAVDPSTIGIDVEGASTLELGAAVTANGATAVGVRIRNGAQVRSSAGLTSAASDTGMEIVKASVIFDGALTISGSLSGDNLEITESDVTLGSAALTDAVNGSGARAERSTLRVTGVLTATGNTADGLRLIGAAAHLGTISGATTHVLTGNNRGLSLVSSQATASISINCDNSATTGLFVAGGSHLSVVGDGTTPGSLVTTSASGAEGVVVEGGSALTLSEVATVAISMTAPTANGIELRGGARLTVEAAAANTSISVSGGSANSIFIDGGSSLVAPDTDLLIGTAGTNGLVVQEGSSAQANIITATGAGVRGCFVDDVSTLIADTLNVSTAGGEGCRAARASHIECREFIGQSCTQTALIAFVDSQVTVLGGGADVANSVAVGMQAQRSSTITVEGGLGATNCGSHSVYVTEGSELYCNSTVNCSGSGGHGLYVERSNVWIVGDLSATGATFGGVAAYQSKIRMQGAATVTGAGTNGISVNLTDLSIDGAVDASGAGAGCVDCVGGVTRFGSTLNTSTATAGVGLDISDAALVAITGVLTSTGNPAAGLRCTDSKLLATRVVCTGNTISGVELFRSSAVFDSSAAFQTVTGNLVDNFIAEASDVRIVGGLDADGAATTNNAITLSLGTRMIVEMTTAVVPVNGRDVGGYALRLSDASLLDISAGAAVRCISAENSQLGTLVEGGSTLTAASGDAHFDTTAAGTGLTVSGGSRVFLPGTLEAQACGVNGIDVSGESVVVAGGNVVASNEAATGITIMSGSTLRTSGSITVAGTTVTGIEVGGRSKLTSVGLLAVTITGGVVGITAADQSEVKCDDDINISTTVVGGPVLSALRVSDSSLLEAAGTLTATTTTAQRSMVVERNSAVTAGGAITLDGLEALVTERSTVMTSDILDATAVNDGITISGSSFCKALRYVGTSTGGWGVSIKTGGRLERGPGAADTLTGASGDVELGTAARTWANFATLNSTLLTDFVGGVALSQLCSVIYTP